MRKDILLLICFLFLLSPINSFSQERTVPDSIKVQQLEEKLNSKVDSLVKLDDTLKKHLRKVIEDEIDDVENKYDLIIYVIPIAAAFILFFIAQIYKSSIEKKVKEEVTKKVTDEVINKIIKEVSEKKVNETEIELDLKAKKTIENVEEKLKEFIELQTKYTESYDELKTIIFEEKLEMLKSKMKDDTTLEEKEKVKKFSEVLSEYKDEKEYTARDWYYKAYDEFFNKNIDNSIRFLTKAIELKPDYVNAYNDRGTLYGIKGYNEKALSDFCIALEFEPDNAQFYANKGIIYYNMKDYDKALLNYNKAIELQPDYAKAYVDRGIIYSTQGNNEEAMLNFNKAVAIDNNISSAYYNRGKIYEKKKEYKEAINEYSKAIKASPYIAENFNDRGWIYLITHYYNLAISDFNKAIELKSDEATFYFNLIIALILNLNYKESEEYLYKVNQLELDNKDKVFSLTLECVLSKILGRETDNLERKLNETLEQDFEIILPFEEIDDIINKANISHDNKQYIKEKMELLKKKMKK